MKDYNIDRIGEVNVNINGYPMKIIQYNSSDDIVVEFLDDFHYQKHTTYGNFKMGKIKNKGAPTVYGVGILGTSPTRNVEDGKRTKEYVSWYEMLRRCYGDKEKFPAYKDVTICEEWFLYDNFYNWVQTQENHDIDGWKLDKDIIKKGNRIYAPDVCCLVPNRVNCLFETLKAKRGNSPIGTSFRQNRNAYSVCCRDCDGKNISLGQYRDKEEAFDVYKQFKESVIRKVAEEEYKKGTITKRCYQAMIQYEVDITD